MEKELVERVSEKTQELISAPSCSQGARAEARAWLDAVGTEREEEETRRYLEELEADIMPVDGLIAFAESEAGLQILGGSAKSVAAHGRELKEAGGAFCDCPACTAAAAILALKESLTAR